MAVKLSNNATSTLSAPITATATSLTVQVNDAMLFPALGDGDWFPATLVSANGSLEIVRVTARDGATMTIQRGQEGTSAKDFPVGSKVDLRLTAGALTDLTTLIRSAIIETLGFTPVQQGGPQDSVASNIGVGWNGSDGTLRLKIDNTEFGSNWPIKAKGNVDKSGDTMTGSLTLSETAVVAFTNGALLNSSGDIAFKNGMTGFGSNLSSALNTALKKQDALGFTPVKQGGGDGLGPNSIAIGWAEDNSNLLYLRVDSVGFGGRWPIHIRGDADGSATRYAQCQWSSDVAEFGGYDSGVSNSVGQCPAPWVMVGLRRDAVGANNISYIRAVQLRNN